MTKQELQKLKAQTLKMQKRIEEGERKERQRERKNRDKIITEIGKSTGLKRMSVEELKGLAEILKDETAKQVIDTLNKIFAQVLVVAAKKKAETEATTATISGAIVSA